MNGLIDHLGTEAIEMIDYAGNRTFVAGDEAAGHNHFVARLDLVKSL